MSRATFGKSRTSADTRNLANSTQVEPQLPQNRGKSGCNSCEYGKVLFLGGGGEELGKSDVTATSLARLPCTSSRQPKCGFYCSKEKTNGTVVVFSGIPLVTKHALKESVRSLPVPLLSPFFFNQLRKVQFSRTNFLFSFLPKKSFIFSFFLESIEANRQGKNLKSPLWIFKDYCKYIDKEKKHDKQVRSQP